MWWPGVGLALGLTGGQAADNTMGTGGAQLQLLRGSWNRPGMMLAAAVAGSPAGVHGGAGVAPTAAESSSGAAA